MVDVPKSDGLHALIRAGPKNGPDEKNNSNKEIAGWDEEPVRLQEAQRNRWISDVWPEDTEYLKV